MKDFFKNVAATIVGIFAFGVIMSILALICLLGMAMSSDKPTIKNNSVLVMKLQGDIAEKSEDNFIGQLTGNKINQLGLNSILASIKKAKGDKHIKGIYLETGILESDYATLQEIRNALLDFKKSGKWVIAYGDMMTQGGYYLASAANKIYLNPEGSIDWHGLSANPMFLKDLYAKFGVKFTVVKVGKFKSYTEQYTEEKMSDANREQVTRYINGLWQQLLTDVSNSRKINKDSLNHYADGIMMVEDAKKIQQCKMVDGLCYYDQIRDVVKKQLGIEKDEKINQMSIDDVNEAIDDNYAGDAIAVYYCEGGITQQATTSFVGAGPEIVSSDVIADLEQLADDDNIKAVVIRINSGGGDAYASEQIWRAVSLLDKKKPVVVSMGGMAASGAYYMSMGARYIMAQPTTLTGSIGIFGAFPDFSGLITQKLGVKFDEVKTNRNSGYASALQARPFTEEEIAYFQNYVNRGYQLFRKRVADGRRMSVDHVEKIAQGRVWLGTDAKNIKLIDGYGGIDDAVAKAAQLAKVKEYHAIDMPNQQGWLEQLMDEAMGNHGTYLDEQMQIALGELYQPLKWLCAIKEKNPIQASVPFVLNIK